MKVFNTIFLMILLHEAVDTLTVDQYMLDLKKFLRDFEHFDPAIWSFQRSDFQVKDRKNSISSNVLILFFIFSKTCFRNQFAQLVVGA